MIIGTSVLKVIALPTLFLRATRGRLHGSGVMANTVAQNTWQALIETMK
jgi:hypothetical protein